MPKKEKGFVQQLAAKIPGFRKSDNSRSITSERDSNEIQNHKISSNLSVQAVRYDVNVYFELFFNMSFSTDS